MSCAQFAVRYDRGALIYPQAEALIGRRRSLHRSASAGTLRGAEVTASSSSRM